MLLAFIQPDTRILKQKINVSNTQTLLKLSYCYLLEKENYNMKKSLLALLVAVPMALTLSGCVVKVNDDGIDHGFVSDSEDRTYENRKKIAKVQLGSSFADMQEKLGVSDFSETYSDNDVTVRVLYYRTQRVHKDGLTTKDECTYLKFLDGKLVETGNGGEFTKG